MSERPRVLDFRDHRRELGDNRYVYAVVSRRAQGLSIGVNLNPGRDCSFDCRYCQVERTTPGQAVPVLLERLALELRSLLERVRSGALWQHPPFDTVRPGLRRVADIAFAGNGEPSASQAFARAVSVVGIERARQDLEAVPLRVLSNGSGLHTGRGQRGLARLHALGGELWFKLDAGSPTLYGQVNRSGVPFERILDNLELAARQRPVVVQSLFHRYRGQAPAASECDAWAERLAAVGQGGGTIREVQVTTVARKPADPACAALGRRELESIAARARALGLATSVHPGRWGRRPVLVSAGATRNPLDSMRCLSANSSGGTGVALAKALSADHDVQLLASPQAALRGQAAKLDAIDVFDSTRDLMARMERWVRANPRGVVIHAAAVGDYEATASAGKVSSGKEHWDVRFTPTPKILDHVRDWAGGGLVLVSFKAAAPGTSDRDLVSIARRQAERTGSDLVFANVLGRLGTGVALVSADDHRWFDHRQDALDALIEHPLLDS